MSDSEIRVKRRTKYASIPNSVIRDTTISLPARGLLIYVMSCSEDWVFYRSQTTKVLGVGRDKYQRLVRELKEARYLIVQPKQLPNGKMDGQEWIVFDEPYPLDDGEHAGNAAQDVAERVENREPENQAGGHREPEKTGRREKPPAGESGPLRKQTKKENKQTSVAPDGAPTPLDENPSEIFDLASEYLQAHPRPIDEPKTREAFLDAVHSDINPHDLIRAAAAYAHEQRGKDLQYILGSVKFITMGRWRQYLGKSSEAPRTATLKERAEFWANSIRDGRHIPPGHIVGDLRMAIIKFNHFTEEELKDRGFL